MDSGVYSKFENTICPKSDSSHVFSKSLLRKCPSSNSKIANTQFRNKQPVCNLFVRKQETILHSEMNGKHTFFAAYSRFIAFLDYLRWPNFVSFMSSCLRSNEFDYVLYSCIVSKYWQ